jgi:hypothetical protein
MSIKKHPFPKTAIREVFTKLNNWRTFTRGENVLPELMEDDNFIEVTNYFGVSIIGYLYIDAKRKVDYQFFNSARESQGTSSAYWMIPYLKGSMGKLPDSMGKDVAKKVFDKYASVVDLLFLFHRYNQSGSAGGNGMKGEYERWTSFNDPFANVGRELDARPKHQETKLWKKFGILYVPYGEMIAFMLMWRRLLHRIAIVKKIDFGDSVSLYKLFLNSPNLPYECTFSNTIQALKEEGGEWDNTYIPENCCKQAAKALIDVIVELDKKDADKNGWQKEYNRVVKPELAEKAFLKYLKSLDIAESNDSKDSIDNLLKIWTQIDSSETDLEKLINALRELHIASRFPIMAYYYWALISKIERTHASIQTLVIGEKEFVNQDIKRQIRSSAILDVRPLEGGILDPTMEKIDDNESESVDKSEETRLVNLCQFVRSLAVPDIESYYFATQYSAEMMVESYMQINQGTSHDTNAAIDAVRNVLSWDDIEFKKGNGKAVANYLLQLVTARAHAFSQPPSLGDEHVSDAIKREMEVSGTGKVAIDGIAKSELLCALIRRYYSGGYKKEQVKTILNHAGLNEKFIEKLLKIQGFDVLADLATLELKDENIDDFRKFGSIITFGKGVKNLYLPKSEKSVFRWGLHFIFAEYIENFLNHEYQAPKLYKVKPLKIEIRVEIKKQDQTAKQTLTEHVAVKECALRFIIGPTESKLEDVKVVKRVSGLAGLLAICNKLSIKHHLHKFALSLNGTNGNQQCPDLPFYKLKDGKCDWKMNSIYLHEDTSDAKV